MKAINKMVVSRKAPGLQNYKEMDNVVLSHHTCRSLSQYLQETNTPDKQLAHPWQHFSADFLASRVGTTAALVLD